MLAAVFLVGGGCTPRAAETAAPPANPVAAESPTPQRTLTLFDRDIPTRPNPKLRTLKLYVGSRDLEAEIALTELQIRTGMMFRTNILENEGMLFVFAAPHEVGFWMKNVIVPLSCAYIDPEGVILETHDMVPGEEASIRSGSDRVQYVLETKQGWFERNDIKPGVLIRTEHGSFRETFFQRR